MTEEAVTDGPKLETGKYCYGVFESSKDENGYIPGLVIENESGYYPMVGKGEGAAPWYWGKTLEHAQQIADKVNAEMGIDKKRSAEIIASSMSASMRKRSW